jgi:Uma2 family endonuclease
MPEDGVRHEVDEGELLVMTRPNYRHGRVQSNLIRILGGHAHHHKLGDVVSESGFILGRNPDILRGPDVAFVRAERVPEVPDEGWAEFGPDLAIEIVSPSDTARQIDRKVHQYLAAGTRAVWIVYPDTQSVQIFEPNGVARVIEAEGLLASPHALPGFEVRAGEIFE